MNHELQQLLEQNGYVNTNDGGWIVYVDATSGPAMDAVEVFEAHDEDDHEVDYLDTDNGRTAYKINEAK